MKQNEKRNYKWRMVEMSNETVITADNVKCIGEILALQALKTTIAYTGKTLHKLYQGLVHDILRSETCTDAFSDGYDLEQTAILFLCEHMGKKLGDVGRPFQKNSRQSYQHLCRIRRGRRTIFVEENQRMRRSPQAERKSNLQDDTRVYRKNLRL